MRTNIEIDDKLIRQAMRISKTRTKKAAVEAALQLMVAAPTQNSVGGRS